ncbi:MAG: bifunctional diaminohydroxyphosphoribosylaminopyrimidine deaminase/5-amino-6-(5-phosphoribosylamino)uracil reductase RibD [Ignavibacteria bacterium]
MSKKNDEKMMRHCIELAKKGTGYVSPNPLVGAVIVKDGKIISEGYHKKFGSSHAEINAINSAKRKGLDLKNSTMYVNLEPCSHFGKTAPCVDSIIKNKFSKVVIGTRDPNPLVSGKGINKLKKNNVIVREGILKKECTGLNKFFFKFIRTGLPYITIKSAQTSDGFIADKNHKSKWISSIESRRLVHKFRNEYDAALVGKNTVGHDNPSLTVRHIKGRSPYRIVIDKKLSLGLNKKIFSDNLRDRTIIISSNTADKNKIKLFSQKNIEIIFSEIKKNKIDLKEAVKKIGKLGIMSILVEGGGYTFSEFIKQKIVDELLVFISPKIMGKGIKGIDIEKQLGRKNYKNISYEFIVRDILLRIKL